MKTPTLVNAQEMAKSNPKTFDAPSLRELNAIKKGTSVKICAGKERFWVSVLSVKGGSIQGKVDNNLISTNEHGLKFGDDILFGKENIYSIFTKK